MKISIKSPFSDRVIYVIPTITFEVVNVVTKTGSGWERIRAKQITLRWLKFAKELSIITRKPCSEPDESKRLDPELDNLIKALAKIIVLDRISSVLLRKKRRNSIINGWVPNTVDEPQQKQDN